jgi:hypothetical protein
MEAENFVCLTPASMRALEQTPALMEHLQQCLKTNRFELLATGQGEADPVWAKAQLRLQARLKELPLAQRMVAAQQVQQLGLSGIQKSQCTEAILAGAHTLVTEDGIIASVAVAPWLRVVSARGLTTAYPAVDKGFTLD